MEKQEFEAKAKEVARILGLTCSIKNEWNTRAILEGLDSLKFSIRNGDYLKKGRLIIHGIYPVTDKGHHVISGNECVEITVAATKTPEKIAHDIQTRFYPVYTPLLEKARNWVESSNQFARKQKANITKIAEYLGVELSRNAENTVYAYDVIKGIDGSIEARGDQSVKFTLSVPPDMAIKVFELLKKGLSKD
jgi:hypothetical protein